MTDRIDIPFSGSLFCWLPHTWTTASLYALFPFSLLFFWGWGEEQIIFETENCFLFRKFSSISLLLASGMEAGNGRFSYFCCLQIGFIYAELEVFIIDGGILNLSFLFCLIVAYSRNFGVSPLIICLSCEFVCEG